MVDIESCEDAILAFAIITMVVQVFAWCSAFLHILNVPEKIVLPCLYADHFILYLPKPF